jgi:signal transduction histidine kinase
MMLENKDSQTVDKAVQKIRTVSEQMHLILSGLQQYVWLIESTVKPTEINLNKLLKLVREQLEKDYPEIAINLQFEELPSIEADWEQMRFLLYQVLANAVQFRKPGNEVKVEVSGNTLLLNKFRKITGKYKYTEFLRLRVNDNGIGFDAAYKDQAFDLFRRLHTESGRGVGLSLCKKIVEHHEGSIDIDSIKGEGTTVVIFLPLHQETVM